MLSMGKSDNNRASNLVENILPFIYIEHLIFLELLKNLQNIIDDYGPVVKVWMGPEPYVILSDAKDIEVIINLFQIVFKVQQ